MDHGLLFFETSVWTVGHDGELPLPVEPTTTRQIPAPVQDDQDAGRPAVVVVREPSPRERARNHLFEMLGDGRSMTSREVSDALRFISKADRDSLLSEMIASRDVETKIEIGGGGRRAKTVYARSLRGDALAYVRRFGSEGCDAPKSRGNLPLSRDDWAAIADGLIAEGLIRAQHAGNAHDPGTRYFAVGATSSK